MTKKKAAQETAGLNENETLPRPLSAASQLPEPKSGASHDSSRISQEYKAPGPSTSALIICRNK